MHYRLTDYTLRHQLSAVYGELTAKKIVSAAEKTNALDAHWKKRWRETIFTQTLKAVRRAELTGVFDESLIDFEDVAMEHSLAVMQSALVDAHDIAPVSNVISFAKAKSPPQSKVPRTFAELRKLWDKYRLMRYIPERQRSIANRVKRAYLNKIQKIWMEYGEAFRQGEEADRRAAVSAMMKGAEISYSRANMTVETETTYYYNKTRKAVYDLSPDITHYLFLAIRDHRTTEWCKSRHGLVYPKDDPLSHRDRPPCHWNCRSEFLPLSPFNPRQLALIQNPSLQRRNNQCKELPAEWSPR